MKRGYIYTTTFVKRARVKQKCPVNPKAHGPEFSKPAGRADVCGCAAGHGAAPAHQRAGAGHLQLAGSASACQPAQGSGPAQRAGPAPGLGRGEGCAPAPRQRWACEQLHSQHTGELPRGGLFQSIQNSWPRHDGKKEARFQKRCRVRDSLGDVASTKPGFCRPLASNAA